MMIRHGLGAQIAGPAVLSVVVTLGTADSLDADHHEQMR